jgi:ATP-dependent DNA helicase RecQ
MGGDFCQGKIEDKLAKKPAASSSISLAQKLSEHFGYSEFRGDQEAIILGVMQGRSALVLMPTGMGKSLCYQLPALLLPGLTLVISPLIALMQDQVDQAQKHGLKASFISSTLGKEERERRYQQLAAGEFQLLYVTPERFRKPEFLHAIGTQTVSLLAVDEAHCISQWGHDFRPDYSRVGEFRERLGNPPTLALTATATAAVQKDILSQLHLEDAPTFSHALERPNLSLNIHDVYGLDEKIRGLVGLRHQITGPGIVYVSLIQTLYKASQELSKLGFKHLIYHGQLPPEERRRNQRQFLESGNEVILATPAFGLGVHKQDVRWMAHLEVPGSIEAYFQEVGRAGRDGKPSECHLFYDQDDVSIQMDFLKWANPEASFISQVYQLIKNGGPGLQDEGMDYLRRQMNFYNSRDFRVETAVNVLERWGSLAVDPKTRLGYRPVEEPSAEMLDEHTQKNRVRVQNEKLLEMVRLATQEEGCRMQTVLEYFDHSSAPCGICDLCQVRRS